MDKRDTIEQLIHRARAGDKGALQELFTRSGPMLKALESKRLREARLGIARPSDIAQETAKRAFEKFASFEGQSEGEWRLWLQKIFTNCIAQSYRAAHQMKRDEDATLPLGEFEELAAPEESQSQVTAHREQQRWLVAHLSHLSDDQKEAMLLHYLKGLSVADVARDMNRSDAAVWGLLSRGLSTLRARFDAGVSEDAGNPTTEPSPRFVEAEAALLLYLRRRDAGEEVSTEAFVAEHPGCAGELRPMLELIERIEAIWTSDPGSE